MDNTFSLGLLRTVRIVLLGESIRRIFQCAGQLPVRDDELLLLVLWAAAVWVFYWFFSRRERKGEAYLYFGVGFVLAELATAKEWHGFRYTQQYGKARMEVKAALTFACMNLKKLAKKRWKDRPIPGYTVFFPRCFRSFFNFSAAKALPT